MTTLDDKLIPKVYALINSYGKTASYEVYAGESYDETTGKTTMGSKTAYSVKITPPEQEKTIVQGDTLPSGDCFCFMSAYGLSFSPAAGHRLVIYSKTWRVLSVFPIYTGESIALYKLLLRS